MSGFREIVDELELGLLAAIETPDEVIAVPARYGADHTTGLAFVQP
jgi:hypothetical protein